jgi:hypothetical protein
MCAGTEGARSALPPTLTLRARQLAQPIIIAVLAVALAVTMVFVFTP